MQRWEAGYSHTRGVLGHAPWVGEFDPLSGVILHEQMELPGSLSLERDKMPFI